ncbi:MAG: hypothetical protein K0V04_33285 [Deltaproteobacteria bacterium]|nr:hypothetical protein [Deltaproteobacteria bacterium]
MELTAAADAFAEGRNTAAWAALDRAEALRPSPDYDYMRGLIRQYQGRCDLAVEHWARYLDSNPAPEDARALQTSIDECGGLPEPEEPIVDPTGADSDPDEDDDRPRPLPPPRPWHRDVTGGVLLGVGIASLAATAGLWAGAGVAQRRGPNSPGLMLHDDRITQSRRLSFAGVGTGVLGTALVVGAIIRYVQMARRQGPSPAARRPRSLARIPRWP